MTHVEARKSFISFFKKKQHKLMPSSSLIPQNDPSILFVNAGMNQFKNIFLGLETSSCKNVITIQKCLRAGGKHNDIEEVGQTPRHHTFFEMMGNFSFGSYFKKEAISLAWEFLTKELSLKEERLWITVHQKDEESYEIWKTGQNIPEHKIYRLDDKDNFWQMGDIGPCGPCTEIHYYKGEEKRPDPKQLMEIWNLVFMEFYDRPGGERQKLSVPCVDTGMGLERLCSLLQNKKSNYHTDLFSEIICSLEQACPFKYDFKEEKQTEEQKAFRVLADHSRAVAFLIADGLFPGNEGENYVLRRLIRRALYYSQKLKSVQNLLHIGAGKSLTLMKEIYPELKDQENEIYETISQETERFFNNLKTGRKKLEESMKLLPEKFIDEKLAWNLYSTYGFPLDLTHLIAKEQGWTVAKPQNIDKIKKEEKQKDQKPSSKILIGPEENRLLSQVDKTNWTAYEKIKDQGKILLIYQKNQEAELPQQKFHNSPSQATAPTGHFTSCKKTKNLKKGKKAWLIADKTCFYPEGGGPKGDQGLIKTETGRAKILDCQKRGAVITHKIEVLEGELKQNQNCEMEVYKNYRQGIKVHHTATHLLNSALRSILGSGIRQAGSLVEPYRLRFDFTYSKALSKKQRNQVEEQVWQSLQRAEAVQANHKSFDRAKKEGFLFLKGENYEQKVRVISIGDKSSKELCGGIHVQNTKEIEGFKIISEKGLQAGVRRIVAYAGPSLKAWINLLVAQNLELREHLKLPLPTDKTANFKKAAFNPQSTAEQNQGKNNDRFQPLIFKTSFKKSQKIWMGFIEKHNPFLQWIENQEKQLKNLRKNIIHLSNKKSTNSLSHNQDFIEIKSFEHPLAQQNLEIREHLKLPLPKEKNIEQIFSKKVSPSVPFQKQNLIFFEEKENPLIDWMDKKQKEIQELSKQYEEIKNLGWTEEKLNQKVKTFKTGKSPVRLLVLSLPLEDRKTLSEISDLLLFKLSLSVFILFGKSKNKHPVLVNLSKEAGKILSANEILKKTVAPICRGQGGGKASYAQGSITDPGQIPKLESALLDQWSKN